MITKTTYFNYIGAIELPLYVADECSHSGSCDNDITRAMEYPEVKAELSKIDPKQLAKELDEYGAWDKNELRSHTHNLRRILWIASGNIMDDEYENNK